MSIPASTMEAAVETAGKDCFTYSDAVGQAVMRVARVNTADGKTFRPWRCVDGEWEIGDPPGPLPLYHLPDLANADRVYVVEGERCADLARQIGLASTTSAHGSSSPYKTDWSPLVGKDIVVLPDNDDAGRKYANAVAKLLSELEPAPSVRIVELPVQGKGDDIVQFVEGLGDGIDAAAAIEELTAKTTPIPRPGLVVYRMSDVVPQDVDWLWEGRLAVGAVNLIIGDGEAGKSFLGIDLATRISRGTPWPDARDIPNPIGSAIIVGNEDSLSKGIARRLDWAGADQDKVYNVRGIRHPENVDDVDVLALDRDLRKIDHLCDTIPDIRLIIFDPVTEFLGTKTDTHKDSDVRRILGPLADWADRRDMTVVAIIHLNKNAAQRAVNRISGSQGFFNLARTSWLVVKDQDDPSRRMFLQHKNNLAPNPGGLAYRIDPPGFVAWEPDKVHMTCEQAMQPKTGMVTQIDRAEEWLATTLKEGPVPQTRLEELAENAGHSWRTIRRASDAEHLNLVKSKSIGDNGKAHWTWALGR